jgi:O-antigen/teichoic acid export membrane protein
MTAANVANAIVTFVGIAYFARTLGAEEIGMFFLFEATVNVLVIPADLGIRSATEKRLSEGISPGSVLTTSFILKLAPLTVIIIGVLLFQARINGYIGADVAILLAITIVAQEFAKQAIQVLRGELRVSESVTPWLSQSAVWVGFGALLVQLGFGVRGLIYGLISGFVVSFAWAMHRRSTPFHTPSWKHVRSLFDYSRYSFVSMIGGTLYNWMDVIIIGYFLTSADVGVYEVAWRVTLVVLLASKAIGTTVFPAMSKWDAERATERIQDLIPSAVTPSLAFVVPSLFGVIVLSQEILGLIFGPEYAGASIVLIILMGGKLFDAFYDVIGRSLNAIDHPRLAAQAAVVSMILNLVLNIVLVTQYGIVGAAIATVVSFIVSAVMCLMYLQRYLTVQLYWRELGWLVVSSIGMMLVLLAIRSAIPIGTIPRLLFVIFLGAAVYGIIMFSFRPLRAKITRSVRTLYQDDIV